MEYFKENMSDEPLTREQFEIFKRRCSDVGGLVSSGYSIHLVNDKIEDENDVEFEFVIRRCKYGQRRTELKSFCYILGDNKNYHLARCYTTKQGRKFGNILHYILWDPQMDILSIHAHRTFNPKVEKERVSFENELLQATLPDEDEMPLQFMPIVDDECGVDDYYNEIQLPTSTYSPDRFLIKDSLSKEIERALHTLEEREEVILRKFFGIGEDEKSLEEIGDELHLTRERVRQIKEKAVHKLESGQNSSILQTYYDEECEYEPMTESELEDYQQYKMDTKELEKYGDEWMLIAKPRIELEIKDALCQVQIKEERRKQEEETEYTQALILALGDKTQKDTNFNGAEQKVATPKVQTKKEETSISHIMDISKPHEKISGKTFVEVHPIRSRQGKKWTPNEDYTLKLLFQRKVTYKDIANHLKRTEGAVKGRLQELHLLLYDKATGSYIIL